jgi:hypothetical protein
VGEELPVGVKAIVVACAVLAVASLVYAGLIWSGQVALSAGAWLLGGGLEQMGPVAFVLYAALLLVVALGLWRRRNWARRVGVIVAGAGIVMAVPAISSAVMDSRIFGIVREGLQIIARVLIVFYLTQEPVKEWFARR